MVGPKVLIRLLCVFQGAEQEPGPPRGGVDVPRSPRSPLAQDAEKWSQPPDGRSLLGPQQHGSPVSLQLTS